MFDAKQKIFNIQDFFYLLFDKKDLYYCQQTKLVYQINPISMKKYLLFCLAAMAVLFVSCDREDPCDDDPRHYEQPNTPPPANNTNNSENGNGNNQGNNDPSIVTITKLYSVVMRREIPYPFQAYVMQISDGNYFYMLRLRYEHELRVGDRISFSVFNFCPSEIAEINGVSLGDGSDIPDYNENTPTGDYLVASNPIEATVKSVFSMRIRYSLTIFPFDTWFIETTDGNLVYVKKLKFSHELRPGDRIVYNVYTFFPNEIVAIKKL